MYFITGKNTETGKKFQKISDTLDKCFEAQKRLADKYGFTQWRGDRWAVAGGISSVIFPRGTKVDTKLWKKVNKKGYVEDEYMPCLKTKQGKDTQAEFDQAPIISKGDLNACIGWDKNFGKSIGFDFTNDKYFGFEVLEEWEIDIPKDCEEVTTTKYRELFKNK